MDPFPAARFGSRSDVAVRRSEVGDAGPDAGLARTPGLCLEFPQDLRVADELAMAVGLLACGSQRCRKRLIISTPAPANAAEIPPNHVI